jgi:hypothetical protein
MTMAHPLLEYIHARFREIFGEPMSMLARDSQWSLRASANLRAPTIFVLVNGSHEKPATWIFDPYDSANSVWQRSISTNEHVEEAIVEIRKRLAAAAHWYPEGNPLLGDDPDGRAGDGELRDVKKPAAAGRNDLGSAGAAR